MYSTYSATEGHLDLQKEILDQHVSVIQVVYTAGLDKKGQDLSVADRWVS